MTNLTEEEVVAFCNHCNWSYQCWNVYRHLFDENPDEQYLKHPHYVHFFAQLRKILHEYWLHEVTKLSDPSVQFGNMNLSLDYVFENEDWSKETLNRLSALRLELVSFSEKLRDVRNKLLSHKDRDTILSGQFLGGFNEGEDEIYFKHLSEFASIVHESLTGKPYLFDDLSKNDVEIFMSTFIRGLTREDD